MDLLVLLLFPIVIRKRRSRFGVDIDLQSGRHGGWQERNGGIRSIDLARRGGRWGGL